jgi:hypothetical protein
VLQCVSVSRSAPPDQEVRSVWRQLALSAQTGSHLQGELHQALSTSDPLLNRPIHNAKIHNLHKNKIN